MCFRQLAKTQKNRENGLVPSRFYQAKHLVPKVLRISHHEYFDEALLSAK